MIEHLINNAKKGGDHVLPFEVLVQDLDDPDAEPTCEGLDYLRTTNRRLTPTD